MAFMALHRPCLLPRRPRAPTSSFRASTRFPTPLSAPTRPPRSVLRRTLHQSLCLLKIPSTDGSPSRTRNTSSLTSPTPRTTNRHGTILRPPTLIIYSRQLATPMFSNSRDSMHNRFCNIPRATSRFLSLRSIFHSTRTSCPCPTWGCLHSPTCPLRTTLRRFSLWPSRSRRQRTLDKSLSTLTDPQRLLRLHPHNMFRPRARRTRLLDEWEAPGRALRRPSHLPSTLGRIGLFTPNVFVAACFRIARSNAVLALSRSRYLKIAVLLLLFRFGYISPRCTTCKPFLVTMLMLAFRVHSNSRILGRRLLQTLPTQTQPDAPPPPSAPSRKQPVQLHPAPVKPPPKTATSTPRPPPPVQTESTVSLKAIKETTSRDIADAEAHGILEPPPADAGWAKSTLHKGIQLAKFYFRGVKLVYTRSGIARDIRLRIANGGSPLERWEHRMLHTQSADLKKIIPFVVTALIIEELIPLIIIWAPRSLPSTCILPSQRERILEKAADEAVNVVTRHGDVLGALARAATDERQIPLDTLKGEDRAKAVCGLLGISTMGPDFLRLRRIQKHLSFIQEDDGFLSRDSRNMSASDLAQALRERGIVPRGLDSAQQTQKLAWWLKSVNAPSTDSIARRVFLVTLLGSR